MTSERIGLLVRALKTQSHACETTAGAIILSATFSEISGAAEAAGIGYVAAENMMQISANWMDQAVSAQSDPAQAAHLLEIHRAAQLERVARIDWRKAKRQVRLIKYQIVLGKLFRQANQVIALNEELHAHKNVAEAWAKAVGAWQQLRKAD
ncbi:MAG: hypothetical protein F4Y00_00765 [Bacteroidetes bacterium SB0662_bin_6]|nr:hypothetical protein [Bacteroidetes bacterium SB0668_bin_1]MYE03498.1 hypothetical protein [Bacteroidetes bacterium SB0662_bin_6]